MKVFLIEWSSNILVESAKALQGRGVEIIYWSGKPSLGQKIKQEFPNVIFHRNNEAVKAIPALGINDSSFEALGKEFLEQMLECESQTLTMMNRMDYSNINFYTRKQLYYKLATYWYNVLKQQKPDAVIFSVVPHMVYDYVIYCICKVLNIKTLMFDVIKLPDRLLLFENIKQNGLSAKNFAENSTYDSSLENLPDDLKNYYLKIVDKERAYYPFYVTGRRFQKKDKINYIPSGKAVLKSIIKGDFFKKAGIFIKGIVGIFFRQSQLTTFDDDFKGIAYARAKKRWQKQRQAFKEEYTEIAEQVDMNESYIFLPLQYQPERSTSPMAGVFTNQILMLDILSSCLPENWYIYVKEHPTQFAEKGVHAQQGRHQGYYKEIAKYNNVRIVSMDASTNKLILSSKAVATATGTAGWEAVLKNKPAIIFGWPFYQFCNGAFQVSNKQECEQAVEEIVKGFQPDKQKIINFLFSLNKVCIKARLGYRFEKDAIVSDKQSSVNIASSIYGKLTEN